MSEEYKASPIAARAVLDYPVEELMGVTDCPEGCVVESDGVCPHGWLSAWRTEGNM